MSVASTIQRSGTPIILQKMLATGGVYDFASATMVSPVQPAPVTIYGVIDGYGSSASRLVNAETMSESGTIELGGTYHVYTSAKIEMGDIMTFGGDSFTVFDVKQVWQKSKTVLYLALVRR